jgi:hypothetical protein
MAALSRLRREWRELVAHLRSRGVVLASIVFLLGLYAIGLVVPQRDRVAPQAYGAWREARPGLVRFLEATGTVDVYASPTMYVALGLFFASLGAVLIDRVPRVVRRTRLDVGIPPDAAALARRSGTRWVAARDVPAALGRAAAVLEARGYRTWRAGPLAVRGVRYRFAPLGFLAFHGSFLVLLAGGITLDLTRWAATANVAEGEELVVAKGPLAGAPRAPRIRRPPPALSFRLLDVRPFRIDGRAVRLEADVLLPGELQPRRLAMNEPLTVGSTTLLVNGIGPAPLLVCEAPGGASDGAYVKIPRSEAGTRFSFEPCGIEVLAQPGKRAADGRGGGVMLQAFPLDEFDGIEIAVRSGGSEPTRGMLRPGEALAAANGAVLRMEELRLFGAFQIVDERGGGLLWLGFALAIAGLLSRLWLYRREVVVVGDEAAGRVLVAAAVDLAGSRRPQAVADEIVERVAGPPYATPGAEARASTAR